MVEQFAMPTRRLLSYFRPGDAVRVTREALADFTGVFVRRAPHQNCIITIDGLATGVSVIWPATSLEMANPFSY